MDKTARIRELNDALRTTFTGGRVMMSAGVAALDEAGQAAVLQKVRTFNAFDRDNEHNGVRYFAKIDYYTPDLSAGSEDPSDPAQTARVMTITRADEY
jgi:hypothetical protein